MSAVCFSDEHYMQQALLEALKAFDVNEVPIGALVVTHSGQIVGRAHNSVEFSGCQAGHAEIEAIKQACKQVGNWRLTNCTIYVTLEPCAMCMNLIVLSRLARLVYGLTSPLFGWSLNNEAMLQVHQHTSLEITQGICEAEIKDLMQRFFKLQRIARDEGKKSRNN